MTGESILVVDDDEDQLSQFCSILEKRGYSVEAVGTGRDALDCVGKRQFQLAVIDVKLPDVSGDEVVRRIRADDNGMGVILVTGYPELQECIDALDLDIHEILLKPIEPEELVRVVGEALSFRVS